VELSGFDSMSYGRGAIGSGAEPGVKSYKKMPAMDQGDCHEENPSRKRVVFRFEI
jgi:hypothetical protein